MQYKHKSITFAQKHWFTLYLALELIHTPITCSILMPFTVTITVNSHHKDCFIFSEKLLKVGKHTFCTHKKGNLSTLTDPFVAWHHKTFKHRIRWSWRLCCEFNSMSRTLKTRVWEVQKGQWVVLCMCEYMPVPGIVTSLPVMGKALCMRMVVVVCVLQKQAVFCRAAHGKPLKNVLAAYLTEILVG